MELSIWTNARIFTANECTDSRIIEVGAIVVRGGEIAWIGPEERLPNEFREGMRGSIDVRGAWITPGFIDCHTHLIYEGNRSREFFRRLDGESYEEIAKEGGGINSTIRATSTSDNVSLLASATNRLRQLMAEGVTSIEIKSGYGGDAASEMRLLRLAKELGRHLPVRIKTTYLGLHAMANDGSVGRAEYVANACRAIACIAESDLADFVDAFCEPIAFRVEEVSKFFLEAKRHGLGLRIHAEQLSWSGGAALAANLGALSADHLEYATESDARALARSGVVAVLLPVAAYCLRERQIPPVDEFRKHRVPMAVATDCNPGTSPCTSIRMAMSMACVNFSLSLEEALLGVTAIAARALGIFNEVGSLAVGKRADFLIWDVADLAEIVYRIGDFKPSVRIWGGVAGMN